MSGHTKVIVYTDEQVDGYCGGKEKEEMGSRARVNFSSVSSARLITDRHSAFELQDEPRSDE
jgi:hypothetical protein